MPFWSKTKKAVKEFSEENGLDLLESGIDLAAELVSSETAHSVLEGVGHGIAGISILIDMVKGTPNANPNPLFINHSIDFPANNHSPHCTMYFKKAKWIGIGGKIVSLAGGLASGVTQVNVGSAARHGRAEFKTIAHLVRLKKIANQIKQSDFLSALCKALIRAKVIKAISRGGQLAGSLIPNPIASNVVGTASSIGGSVAMMSQKALITKTSILLHWRAYQEYKLTRIFGGDGPAMRMVRELFGNAIRVGEQDWSKPDRYIQEPAGWMVINHKASLL